MKKILLALFTLMSVISYSQTTGYLRYDSVRIMKAGANSNLIIESATRDSLGFLYNYGNGRTRFEVIRAVAGGIKVGEDTIIVGAGQGDFLIGGSVTPEGGFRFSVQEATYGIEGIIYLSDSATVFVDSADATYDRFDVIYLDSDQTVKVLTGIPAENPAIPQLPSGTILLTVVSVEAGAIQANTTSINVYFENDATITPSGTTAVGNATAAPYAGTYHIRITTNNNGDFVDIIKTSGTWDISGQDFLSFHIKNRATIPQLANWRASLWNGASTGSQVSGEVILNYNKSNSTTYQAISIPMAAFGNITNTNIDRIRLRYTSNNATNHTGIELDNIFFGDNLQQPGTGNFSATLNMPSAFTVSPTNTIQDNGIWNVTANGSTAQYIRGDGSLATFSAVTTVGAFGSQASQANGAFISGSTIYFQPVTATEPGMATSAMMIRWDSSYTVENMSSLGESIMVNIDAARTGFKGFVGSASVTITPTDSTLVFTSSGGTAQRFGFATEDDAAGESRSFTTNTSLYTFKIEGSDGVLNTQYIDWYDSQNLKIGSVGAFGAGEINFNGGQIQINNLQHVVSDPVQKLIAIDTATNILYTVPVSGGGGSGTVNTGAANRLAYYPASATTVDDLAAITANSLLASDANGLPVAVTGVSDTEAGYLNGVTSAIQTQLDGKVSNNFATGDLTLTGNRAHELNGNTLNINQGGNSLLGIDPTVNSESATIRALNITDDDNISQIGLSTSDTQAQMELVANFNNVKLALIEANATASVATLEFTAADGITFAGNILTATDNTYDLFSAAASGKDGYLRRLLLDGSTSGTPIIESDALGDVLLGTVLSGQGTIPVDYDIVTRADETLANSTSDQPVFTNTAHDVIAVVANMTYDFEVRLDFTHGAVSHNIEFGMIPTTATITSIEYNALGWVTAVGTNTASQNTLRSKSTATTQVIAAGANGTETLDIKGTFTVGATGGSIMPTIQFSADPTGTILLKTGARFKLTARGNDTFTQKGPIN